MRHVYHRLMSPSCRHLQIKCNSNHYCVCRLASHVKGWCWALLACCTVFTNVQRKITSPDGIFYFSYSMYVQRVHSKVVRVHIEAVKNLLESHLFPCLFQHHTVGIGLVCFLDEGQQVFLRHAGSCMNMCVHLKETMFTQLVVWKPILVWYSSYKKWKSVEQEAFIFLAEIPISFRILVSQTKRTRQQWEM